MNSDPRLTAPSLLSTLTGHRGDPQVPKLQHERCHLDGRIVDANVLAERQRRWFETYKPSPAAILRNRAMMVKKQRRSQQAKDVAARRQVSKLFACALNLNGKHIIRDDWSK